MLDTSETSDTSSTRSRTTYAEDLSYRLKMNEFDDLTNTCCPEVDRDRTTTQATSFEEECGSQTELHHKPPATQATTYAVQHATASTHARAGAPLYGGTTRVGLHRYPQYTRAWFAREALGCSQTTHHSTTTTRQPPSPTVFKGDAEVPTEFQKISILE